MRCAYCGKDRAPGEFPVSYYAQCQSCYSRQRRRILPRLHPFIEARGGWWGIAVVIGGLIGAAAYALLGKMGG